MQAVTQSRVSKLCVFFICIQVNLPPQKCTRDGTTFSKPDDCTQYYSCSNGTANIKSCPGDQTWNCARKQCTNTIYSPCCVLDPEISSYNDSNSCLTNGLTLADDLNCGRYFMCLNNLMVDQSCDSNQIFDSETMTCVKGHQSVCRKVKIEGKRNMHYIRENIENSATSDEPNFSNFSLLDDNSL